ncbi:MAG: class I SAM-dependent methyltransferase [Nocardioidaceae bacterium]|nr:class I SAM-dependent methyltransferase [Nocardioidaceae bacterium]
MRNVEELFARALRGEPCVIVGLGDEDTPLPVGEWLRSPDADDEAMLRHCLGPTLDIGCGPGRMTAALARTGQVALGIDVVGAAVAETCNRGGVAMRRDLFDPLPGEGRWACALLADGNVGIGGDPERLLSRVRGVLTSGGRAIVEVAEPGIAAASMSLCLDVGGSRSHPFPWAFLGADDIGQVATNAGLMTRSVHQHGERWCAVLEVP